MENDIFEFRIVLQDRPLTRCGILSTVGSIYDPNGYLAPVMLKGRQVLQRMFCDKLDWDDPVPDELRAQWDTWRQGILSVKKFKVQRCFKPPNFGDVKLIELHHFSDASFEGYGQCSYIRLVNEDDKVYVSFVIGKARVTPMKQMTVPRLEFMAATVSARMSKFLREELSYQEIKKHFWTGYINNDAKRFHTYVANRVQEIRDVTKPSLWGYVESKENPADDASHGSEVKHLVNGSRWLNGPSFLWEAGALKPRPNKKFCASDVDPEVKKVVVNKVCGYNLGKSARDIDRLNQVSVALCQRLKTKLKNKDLKHGLSIGNRTLRIARLTVSLTELQEAEKEILRTFNISISAKKSDFWNALM